MGVSVEVKGGWRVNAFLFFLTGSQAVLYPWASILLKAAGVSPAGAGVIMGMVTVSSSIGICGCLLGMRRTHSGAARRLLLLVLTLVSSLSFLFAVLLLPSSAGGTGCLPASSTLSATPDVNAPNNSQTVSPKPDSLNVNMTLNEETNVVPDLHTTTPTTVNTTTISIVNISDNIPNVTEIPVTKINTTTSTTTKGKVDAEIIDNSNKSEEENIKTLNGNENEALLNSSGDKTTNKPAVDKDSGSLPIGSEVQQEQVDSSLKNIDATTENSFENDDKYETDYFYYDDNNDNDDDTNDNDNENGNDNNNEREEGNPGDDKDSFVSSLRSSNDIRRPNLYPPIYPPLPPPSSFSLQRNNKNNHQNIHHYNIHKENPNNRKWQKAQYLNKNNNNYLRSKQKNNPNFSNYHGHSKQNSYNNRIRNNFQYPPEIYDKSRNYPSYHDGRHKRFVEANDQYLGVKRFRSVTSGKMDETNEASNNESMAYDIDIHKLPGDISFSVGIQTGVAILIIIGSLTGSGIEVGVAQLWHCYAHGYDESSGNHDLMEATITHTFQLSVYAHHKIWSGLTSGIWVVAGGVITSFICMLGANTSIYGMLGGLQITLGICAVLMLFVIPLPYGSVEPPKVKRPLSLYLDDEVLREGVRRLAFHIWVLVNGCLMALPLTYRLWVILEMGQSGTSVIAAQTGAIAATFISESIALFSQRWLISRTGLHGTMGVGGLALMLHLALMWAFENLHMIAISHVGLGCSMALMWVSVRHNALLLATVNDQEREAWASWWCWQVGVSMGAVIWGLSIDVGGTVVHLFKPASFIAASVALVVATAAVFTSRRHGRTRRRVYHTLDLDMAGDEMADDEDEEEANEDDWLVRRAKKEGISL